LSSVVCLGFIAGLRESLSTSTQMTQMEQIAADYYISICGDLLHL
jgi:hypothetical protein